MHLWKLLSIIILLSCGIISARADEISIIATVGDEAITTEDLIARTRLIIISSGLKADEETAKKIAPQILQSLINEKIYMQEAHTLEIKISDEEVNKAIQTIEQQNKMKPGGLKDVLAKAEVPYATLEQQVRGQIAWTKIKAKKIQPNITITDDEISDYVKSQDLQPTQDEYYVNEIVLPVETDKDEPKILQTGEKLAADLRSGKADFKKVARQFSGSASARAGGDVGWLKENQIPKELLVEIKKYGLNKIIGPVKSVEGFFILDVTDMRTINAGAAQDMVTIKQFEIGPGQAKSEADAFSKAKSINDVAAACDNAADYAKAKNVSTQSYDNVQINQLKPELQNTIITLPVKTFSKPILTHSGVSLFVTCNRILSNSAALEQLKKDKAKDVLFKRQMELESRKFLRDLRRDTNIELKGY